MNRREEIRKADELVNSGIIEEQEVFKHGMVIGAEWADANPAWIRCVDEMPPIGVNVLTRVIKGDGTVIFQVDKRTEFEWVNLCHYDKVSHWMKINFREE